MPACPQNTLKIKTQTLALQTCYTLNTIFESVGPSLLSVTPIQESWVRIHVPSDTLCIWHWVDDRRLRQSTQQWTIVAYGSERVQAPWLHFLLVSITQNDQTDTLFTLLSERVKYRECHVYTHLCVGSEINEHKVQFILHFINLRKIRFELT